MKILPRLTTALAVALGGLVALADPAAAATPTVISPVLHSVVAPDAAISIAGTGCPAASPVSIEIQQTTAVIRDQLDSVTVSDASGNFTHHYDLDNRWGPGVQMRVTFSCTPTFQWDAPGLASNPSFFWLELDATNLQIEAPVRARYGVATTVALTSPLGVEGARTFTVDGVPIAHSGGVAGHVLYRLPRTLAVGTHRLAATFDPSGPGPTSSTTATLRVTRALSSTGLRTSTQRVRRDHAFAVRVTLRRTGIAPRTGVVEIRDGSRTVKRIRIRSSDDGTRRFLIRLPRTGPRNIRAVYLGNAKLAPSRSAVTVIRVRR